MTLPAYDPVERLRADREYHLRLADDCDDPYAKITADVESLAIMEIQRLREENSRLRDNARKRKG